MMTTNRALSNKQYYEKNKESHKESMKRYKSQHEEEIKLYNKAYYQKRKLMEESRKRIEQDEYDPYSFENIMEIYDNHSD